MHILDWLVEKLCKPDSIVWGNCYLAILLFIRKGGHLIVTRSTGHPVIPHIAWTAELPPTQVQHLMPIKRRFGWRAIFCSPVFKGKWVTQVIQGKNKQDR